MCVLNFVIYIVSTNQNGSSRVVQSNVLNSIVHESVAAGSSTNDMAAPELSNQRYLTLQLVSL